MGESDKVREATVDRLIDARIEHFETREASWDTLDTWGRGARFYSSRYEDEQKTIAWPFHESFHRELAQAERDRLRAMDRQYGLLRLASTVTPLGAATTVATELARTGYTAQRRAETAAEQYHPYFLQYVYDRVGERQSLQDFSPFRHTGSDTLAACLGRNALQLATLVLLSVLGFAGAYVSILRYDVR